MFLEFPEGVTFVHCDVLAWSPSIAKQMRADFDALYEMHGGPMFAINQPYGCKKHRKFMQMHGFSFEREVIGLAGQAVAIFKR